MSRRASVFLSIARPLRILPNFRGKVRVLLEFYRMLGLSSQHVKIETTLSRPVMGRFQLDLHSLHERMAFLMDEYESDTVEFLLKLHSGGGAFIDIGANIGLISIPFAKKIAELQSDCVIYSIEAVSSNIESLSKNIALNKLEDRITIIHNGVGDTAKNVEIQVEGNLAEGQGSGTANILPENSQYKCERIPISITTLDILFAQGKIPGNVNLIKVDIDGYDLLAMLGASDLLSKTRPVIFGEFMAHCLNWHKQSLEDVVAFMQSLEFSTFARCHPEWEFTATLNTSTYVQDLLILPNERINEFRWCLRDAA